MFLSHQTFGASRRRWTAVWALLLTTAGTALADGMIVPIRPDIQVRGHWAVTYHHVDIRVRHQVAHVSIEQEFINTGGGMIEVEYLFPVPPDAAINSMTLMVNGQEFAAKLMKADEARRIYEEIVRKKKDPALLEYAGFGLYRTRAFPLEPGKPAKVLVTYQAVCNKADSTIEVWYPLNTEKFSAQPIPDVRVRTDVEAEADITTVYSPSHPITIERQGARRVIATCHAQNVLPTTDFQLFYKAADEQVGATVLSYQPPGSDDGYCLMLVSPNPSQNKERIVPREVVLVLDRSGSMNGDKIQQARQAARFVLDRLNEQDRFNLVVYSDRVDTLWEHLQPADAAHRQEAAAWVDQITAAGGTDIHSALQTAMGMCGPPVTSATGMPVSPPQYVIFLTDGLPTIGNTNEAQILGDAKRANWGGVRLFTFGVGYDVNVRLLDKLVGDNRGRSDYVKPNEPIETKVNALATRIQHPVMTGLELSLQGVKLIDVYPRQLGDLFRGDQLIVVGRFSASQVASLPSGPDGHVTQLVLTGQYAGEARGFEYPVALRVADKRHPFVETLWAARRIGWLLDQVQLNGESDEVVDELVRLSMKHGIITPYTSFLADETTALHQPEPVRAQALRNLESAGTQVKGAAGQIAADTRAKLNTATEVPEAAADADGGGGGMIVYGNSGQDDYEQGRKERVDNVRRVGNRAQFQRGRQWVDASATDVDPARDADKIQVVERMSEEYFELVRLNTVEENQVLASQGEGEELIIRLRGQVYNIR